MGRSDGFRLLVLGRLELFVDGDKSPARISSRKARALVAYLAMAPAQAASREELATLLWGDCSDSQARQSLRQALLTLRREIGPADLLLSDAQLVHFPPGGCQVDAIEFDALSKSTQPQDLHRAAALFQGEFAAGFHLNDEGFDEWLTSQRLRVQRAAMRLCETFAARPDLVLDPDGAIGASERLLALDPLREAWQRLVLVLHARYRGQSEALALAQQFAQLLKRELGVGPEAETQALLARIRDGAFARNNPTASDAPAPATAAPSIQTSGADPNTGTLPPASAPDRRSASFAYRVLAAASIAVFLAAGALFGLYYSQRPPADRTAASPGIETGYWITPASPRGRPSPQALIPIVVLPFTAFAPQASNPADGMQLAADMLTDDLINILSRNRLFRVISRQTARNFADKPLDIAALRSELQVRYVLEGSVRLQDDKLRVNISLIDTASKTTVWSDRIERDGADRRGVQDEVVARLARELQLEILPIETARRQNDPDADAIVFRGWAAMNAAFARTGTDTFKKAEEFFKQALERDPQNLSAMIGLGAYHANLGAQVLDSESATHLKKAEQILLGVLERDRNNGPAPFYLGLVYGASGRIEEALASFQRAVEVNPSHSGAHGHIGHALARLERAEEGLEHLHYALRLSPRDPNRAYWYEFIGSAEMALGRYPAAIESFERSASLNPGYPRSWAGLAAAHALAGQMDAARKHAEKLRTFAPGANVEALIKRFGRDKKHSPKLHEGLRLALAPPPDRAQLAPSSTLPAADDQGQVSLAVLPFAHPGSQDDHIALAAEILADDLNGVLSRSSALRVISRQTSRTYRDTAAEPAAIGAELRVRYLLRGSIKSEQDALLVDTELFDTKEGRGIWSQRFKRDRDRPAALLDEIANGIGRELSVEVTLAESRRSSPDPTVHELVFKGRAAIFGAAKQGAAELAKAEAFFVRALELDPGNVHALTGLANYHVLMAVQLFAADPAPHLAKADALLQPILDNFPSESAPYYTMGMLQIASGRPDNAVEWFERALTLNPSDAPSYAQLGRLLIRKERAPEGLARILYAMRLSPRDPSMPYWLGFAGAAELEMQHDASALNYLERAVALHPTQPRTLLVLAAAQALAGNASASRTTLAKVQAALPHLSGEALIKRFFNGQTTRLPRLQEGLRLLTEAPADAWQSPGGLTDAGKPPAATPAQRLTSLAVLPFTTYGEQGGSIEQMADAVTGDVTDVLSRIPALRVIARGTMRTYAGQKTDIASIGTELGVRYVLEGNMRMHDDKLRVNVELVDPASRLSIWTARLDYPPAERHKIQDEIVGRLGRELHYEIYKVESERDPADPSIEKSLYKGWNKIINHADFGLDHLEDAKTHFDKVLAQAPDNTSAKQGLAWYHVLAGSLLLDGQRSAHLDAGEALIAEVLRARPGNSGVHFINGLLLRMRGQYPAALEAYQRALELNPSFSSAYAHIGHTMIQTGRTAEGIAQIRYALRLSPKDSARSHWLRFLGEGEAESGDLASAIETLHRSYHLNPRQPLTLRALASVYALSGDAEAARRTLAELKAAAPHLTREGMFKLQRQPRGLPSSIARGWKLALATDS